MTRRRPASPRPTHAREIQAPARDAAAGLDRRAVLALAGAFAAGGALAPTGARAEDPPAPPALGDGERFDPAAVVALARALAAKPYAAPPSALPDAFGKLTYEQYIAIRPKPELLIWRGEGRGFVVEPLHRGYLFTNPVSLHTVEDGIVRRIPYDRDLFEFRKTAPPEAGRDLGFSGFRLYGSFGGGPPADCAIFQGASFFRALAAGQSYGITARALTLRPAEARGEEFPLFRAFWLERPGPASTQIVMHALIDSDSAAAALRMTLRPGDATIVDIEATLCPRTSLDHVGLGGMTGAYLFGPADHRNTDDARPAAHEIGGLQIRNGGGEALWRPVQNPETLQISSFLDQDPKGFGLVQRHRDYADYQDDVQHWERRPSLWIEPFGTWQPGQEQRGWGPGAVQLIEIPSESEVNENILAYWRPKEPIARETAFTFRQYWCWDVPGAPPLARCTGTRIGKGSSGKRRLFLVDFAGDALFAPEVRPESLKLAVTASPGTIVQPKPDAPPVKRDPQFRPLLYLYPERKTVRAVFELDPGGETACEMRLVVKNGDQPVSETWLFRWTP
ncbi:periplasmic glucan biosynthesis protein MdoG [Methylobacterium sp. 4-46]|uniref:glucan biosynthesis protein D n=1 Tax=unclassified Methylobacterium TaxID=2615210 RepID=UPI000152D875|nr:MULTISPECIES: glucan biosynthesis protein [Methylobacterium]ACA19819.1 periplasmic glucan biosynthesis protein MdoG [Methylobacterium sp. 4-46]WFT79004.1 glucan biosynthesis protein D [Methylobacterium nodulans]